MPLRHHRALSRSSFCLEPLESRICPADLRVVSYNITATGGTVREGIVGQITDSNPANDFGILDTIGLQNAGGISRPADIILLQETSTNLSAVQTVAARLNDYYGGGTYAAGKIAGSTTGGGTQGIVYKTSTVDLMEELAVGTTSGSGAARQALRYKVRADGTTSEIYIYNAHLKASDTSADAQRRLVETQAIRADALPANAHVLYAGDFNFYDSDSSEPAYAAFRAPGPAQAQDVANPAGNWKRESNAWLSIYTQAPATNPGGGLVGGGLDDRFDFILSSAEFTDGTGVEYLSGTYRTFGNNGSVPLHGNINVSSSTALSNTPLSAAQRQSVLDYLTTASDHLPVVMDLHVPSELPATLQFGAAEYSVNESGSLATITVSRSGGLTGAVSVNYSAVPGSAMPAQDFQAVSGTLQFANNQSIATFTVPVFNDSFDESNETVLLNLSAPVGAALGSPSSATLTITDDDAAPSLTVSDSFASEGNNGTSPLTFAVALSDSSALPVTLNYATSNGSAATPIDYLSASGMIQFAPGESLKQITLQIVGDVIAESNENFNVTLTNPTNAVLADALGVGTILDDDSGDFQVAVGTPRLGNASGPEVTGEVAAGSVLFVPVRLRITKPGGIDQTDIAAANVALSFDNTRLEYQNAFRGTLLDANAVFMVPVSSGGELRLSSFDENGTSSTLAQGIEEDLFLLQFAVRSGASGNAVINLLQNLTGPTFSTRISAINGTFYTIVPTPTNTASDIGVDRWISTTSSPQPAVLQFVVNEGASQRSRVTRLQLTFNGPPALTPANFALTNTITNTPFAGSIAVTT